MERKGKNLQHDNKQPQDTASGSLEFFAHSLRTQTRHFSMFVFGCGENVEAGSVKKNHFFPIVENVFIRI